MKKVARDLLEKLQEQLAVDELQTKQQTRATVQTTIRFTLNDLPEDPYPEPVWNEKVDAVWAFISRGGRQAARATQCMSEAGGCGDRASRQTGLNSSFAVFRPRPNLGAGRRSHRGARRMAAAAGAGTEEATGGVTNRVSLVRGAECNTGP